MQLEHEDIKKFQELWHKSFGETVSEEKAIEEATALLILIESIYKTTQKEYSEKSISQPNLL